QAAVARAAIPASANGGASLLDASGYVVAQLQATVSAKVTGKVLEVPIEEGQFVEKGQVMARLDDSNTSASLSQAAAQIAQAEANLASVQSAYDNAKPIYERNVKLRAQGWISDTALDTSKAAYDAARTGLDVAKRGVAVARSARALA